MGTLIRVAVDRSVNLKKLKGLERRGLIALFQVEHHFEKPLGRGPKMQRHAFVLDESTLDGEETLAGEQWDQVRAILGKQNERDAWHLYHAFHNRNDYFISEDRTHFIDGGNRERLEGVLGLKIRRTDEFLAEMKQQGVTVSGPSQASSGKRRA